MHITTVLHTRCLHTCKLLVSLICAACIHTCYYSAAYTLLTHMQATSVPHMCSYTCILLQCCIHAAYTLASSYVQLAYMHITTVLHTCCLHTCKLLEFLICAACIHAYYYSAACIHAYYYSAAYTLLTHMQATSVPHMCSLHTCILLQCCIHAYTHASY